MPISDLKLSTVSLDDLRADSENPRTHDARNLAAIAASLREHGQVEPLLVQKSTMMIIGGNGRAEAMRSLGWTKAKAAVLDISDVEARRLSITLNRTSELAGWDDAILAKHLSDLASAAVDFDPASLGFTGEEMDTMLNAYINLREIPEQVTDAPKVGVTKVAPGSTAEDAKQEPPSQTALPPGTVPAPMPSSDMKVVQLYFDDEAMAEFQMAVRTLADKLGTDNVSETVRRAVLMQAGAWR